MVACQHYQYLYTAQSQEEFLQRAKDDTDSQCTLSPTPPIEVEIEKCSVESNMWFSHPVDRCNVTGRWEVYDEEVKDNCYTLTDRPYRVLHQDSNRLFANLFCAMCNGVEPQRAACALLSYWPRTGEFDFMSYDVNVAPLSLLFSVQERNEDAWRAESGECSDGKSWLAPDVSCKLK